MKRPIDTLPGESLKQDIYTHSCCSASECTFNYKKRGGPLDVHYSWLRALLGLLVLESKSIHLASTEYQVSSGLSLMCDWCVPTPQLQMGPRLMRWHPISIQSRHYVMDSKQRFKLSHTVAISYQPVCGGCAYTEEEGYSVSLKAAVSPSDCLAGLK